MNIPEMPEFLKDIRNKQIFALKGKPKVKKPLKRRGPKRRQFAMNVDEIDCGECGHTFLVPSGNNECTCNHCGAMNCFI